MPTKPAKKPTRGRPPAYKAEDRRSLLLDAALTLFARQGIAATSLNAIAKQAKVTPALVHYYFGNREQLVEIVLAERIVPVVDQLSQELTHYPAAPLQAIYALARRMLAAMQDQPWLPPLWVREVLCEGGLLRDHLLQHIAPHMAKKVRQLAVAAQQEGQLNSALDPRLLIVSLIGLTLFPLAAAPIWQQLPGYKTITTEQLAQHMLALLAHGIETPVEEKAHGARAD
jgi:TetR/AcrR family transcriptional regulator